MIFGLLLNLLNGNFDIVYGQASITHQNVSELPKFIKVGKVCVLAGSYEASEALGGVGVVALGSGYPATYRNNQYMCLINDSTHAVYRAIIDNDGYMKVLYLSVPAGRYTVAGSYIIK